MVAVLNNHPLLQTGHCVISDYGTPWLEEVLQEAADTAGVHHIPFRAEIAQAVMLWLEKECPLRSVPLEYLFARLREVLHKVGLPLIAENLRCQTPPVNIDLRELAEADPLPLFFYTELQHRLDGLQRLGFNTYRFSGRKSCSLALGSRRRACPTQQRALEELDAFLSARHVVTV